MVFLYVNTKMKNFIKRKRATGVVEVIAVVALIGLAVAWFKPSLAKSNAKEVDKVTNKVEEVQSSVDGKVSASVNQIGVANEMAPDSPSKNFIRKEVQLVTPLLPAPNLTELLEAEKRRLAVMEGRYAEADKLYREENKENKKLLAEREVVKAELAALKVELYEQAAVAEFFKKASIVGSVILALLLGAYIWLRINSGKVFGGLREFVTYTKDEKVLGDLREALDSTVKRKLGL